MENRCAQTPPCSFELEPAQGRLVEGLIKSLDHPDRLVQEVVLSRRFVGIKTRQRLGLASALGARPSSEEKTLARDLVGRPLKEAAELLLSDSLLCRSLGLAGLNAGLDPPQGGLPLAAEELLLQAGSGQEVVIVGDFPFAQRVGRVAAQVHLLELKDLPGRLHREE
ncbi:MAG: DUF4213 domain-containing protein [Deltaproteobacteria bacterium]|nr:DUF4213 domain-containing protein [Deltaproteobacteria bacterium]